MGQSLNFSAIRFYCRAAFRTQPNFKPKLIVSDIRCIPFQDLKYKGYSAIAFDKDNTLTAPYSNHLHPQFKEKWEECKKIFGKERMVIVSNSAGSEDDYHQASQIESTLGVPVLRHSSGKKKPEGGEDLINHFHMNSGEKIVFVGDRILTDIVYANSIGAYSILCNKIITKQGDNKIASMVRWFFLLMDSLDSLPRADSLYLDFFYL